MPDTYRVIRFYLNDRPKRTIERGLSLEQAQAHCSDPESSSKTATTSAARQRTRRLGPWFDGYDRDKPARRRR